MGYEDKVKAAAKNFEKAVNPDFIAALKDGGGVVPEGTINITENGEVDVTDYATAVVNVSGGGDVKATTYTMTLTLTGVGIVNVEGAITGDIGNGIIAAGGYNQFTTSGTYPQEVSVLATPATIQGQDGFYGRLYFAKSNGDPIEPVLTGNAMYMGGYVNYYGDFSATVAAS